MNTLILYRFFSPIFLFSFYFASGVTMKRHLNTDKLLGNVFLSPTKRNNHCPCRHNSPALKRPKQQTNRRTNEKKITSYKRLDQNIYIYIIFFVLTPNILQLRKCEQNITHTLNAGTTEIGNFCVPQTKTST